MMSLMRQKLRKGRRRENMGERRAHALAREPRSHLRL